jgi:putative ABC transport system permease protein
LIGIVCSLGLIVIINIILFHFTGIASLQAVLEPVPAIILVAISMILTFVAGLFPSKTASNKDPVIALRSE